MDVDEYLRRINYMDDRKPTLNVLRNLCWQHVSNVPYDTLGLRNGQRRLMKVDELYKSIVIHNRGGFCFELNGLFCWLLQHLGFRAEIIQAQGYKNNTFSGDYGHMAIKVTLNDNSRWLVDTAVLGSPVRLDITEIQTLRNGLYRICRKEHDGIAYLYLEKYIRKTVASVEKLEMNEDEDTFNIGDLDVEEGDVAHGEWKNKLRFQLTSCELGDFQEMMDFYQTSLESGYAHNTFCVLHKENGYMALWGKTLVQKAYLDYHREVVCATALDNETIRKVLKEKFKIKGIIQLDLNERDVDRLLLKPKEN